MFVPFLTAVPIWKFHFLCLLLQPSLVVFFLFEVLCLPLSPTASVRIAGLLSMSINGLSKSTCIRDFFSETPLNTDTPLIRTIWPVPLVSVLTRFHCTSELPRVSCPLLQTLWSNALSWWNSNSPYKVSLNEFKISLNILWIFWLIICRTRTDQN